MHARLYYLQIAVLILYSLLINIEASTETFETTLERPLICPKCPSVLDPICGWNGYCARWFQSYCDMLIYNCENPQVTSYELVDDCKCSQCCNDYLQIY